MSALTCDLCGGKLVMGTQGVATCDSCGMEHSADRMKEKVQEIKGTVRVDSTHMIDNYIEMAQSARNAGNNAEAESYCNKIIEIDPANYTAWMIKGEAAAWQSTLQNSRFGEGVRAFAKGIEYAPEDEKEDVIETAKDQIKSLSIAMISLRADRFAKWPDEEETQGFTSDLTDILNTVITFIQQAKVAISVSEIMAPIATQINQAVVQAYQKVIYPEYKSERYPYPDRDDWQKYIKRIDFCITLVTNAVKLCDDDDEADIQRYENLISLQKAAIESCSYDSEYLDYDPYNNGAWAVQKMEAAVRSDGNIPDSRNSRYYYKDYALTGSAIATRNVLISAYTDRINNIKKAKAEKEAEEAKKRFDYYWVEHADEKVALEAEKNGLNSQISALNTSLNDQVSALNKKISSIPGKAEIDNIDARVKKLTEEKSSLGLFKGKEKKALQEQIDQANTEKKTIQNRMDAAKEEIESKISSIKSDFQKKISPLQSRINEISNELTKAR